MEIWDFYSAPIPMLGLIGLILILAVSNLSFYLGGQAIPDGHWAVDLFWTLLGVGLVLLVIEAIVIYGTRDDDDHPPSAEVPEALPKKSTPSEGSKSAEEDEVKHTTISATEGDAPHRMETSSLAAAAATSTSTSSSLPVAPTSVKARPTSDASGAVKTKGLTEDNKEEPAAEKAQARDDRVPTEVIPTEGGEVTDEPTARVAGTKVRVPKEEDKVTEETTAGDAGPSPPKVCVPTTEGGKVPEATAVAAQIATEKPHVAPTANSKEVPAGINHQLASAGPVVGTKEPSTTEPAPTAKALPVLVAGMKEQASTGETPPSASTAPPNERPAEPALEPAVVNDPPEPALEPAAVNDPPPPPGPEAGGAAAVIRPPDYRMRIVDCVPPLTERDKARQYERLQIRNDLMVAQSLAGYSADAAQKE